MLQAALPNGFRLRMLPRSVQAVFRQTGEIFYIGGADVLPAPLEGQAEADAIAGLSDPENETARSELIEHNLRLVVYIAQKFDNTGVGVEDLISIGTIGSSRRSTRSIRRKRSSSPRTRPGASRTRF